MEVISHNTYTADQEIQLWDQERIINRTAVSRVGGNSRIDRSGSEYLQECSIGLLGQEYTQRKQAELIGKIKNEVIYEHLWLQEVSDWPKFVNNILQNNFGRGSKNIWWLGSGKSSKLSKKLLTILSMIWSTAEKDIQIRFGGFHLSHKQFWRVIFSMRHIKAINILKWKIQEIKAIHTIPHLRNLNLETVWFQMWEFTFQNDTTENVESVRWIIDTLANLQKMKPQLQTKMMIFFELPRADQNSLDRYIDAQGLSHLIVVV